jgi:hypothetical protein
MGYLLFLVRQGGATFLLLATEDARSSSAPPRVLARIRVFPDQEPAAAAAARLQAALSRTPPSPAERRH